LFELPDRLFSPVKFQEGACELEKMAWSGIRTCRYSFASLRSQSRDDFVVGYTGCHTKGIVRMGGKNIAFIYD